MTNHEKKIFAVGAGAGLLAAALILVAMSLRTPRLAKAAGAESPAAAAMSHEDRSMPSAGTQPGATVELTPEDITAAGVQVAEVKAAKVPSRVSAFGRVEQPESQLAAISARIGGRIDRLLLQYAGQQVRRGQPVAELYSPEVATALQEYQVALGNRDRMAQSGDREMAEHAEAIVAASQRRLELLEVSGKQLHTNTAIGTPHVTIYSDVSGVVVERKATRGQYVNAGDTLFSVADLSTVWVKADVYESQLPQIRSGQMVELTSEALPNQTIHGRVEFIEPMANAQTRTVPVHVHVSNPGMRLLPGMYVAASFVVSPTRETLVVPRSAVLDTGTRKLVYVAKGNGAFEAREVETGTPTEDVYPILQGLKQGEQVVMAGNFLIDSQTRLNGGMTGLFGGSKEFSGNSAAQSSGQSATAGQSQAASITLRVDPDPAKGAADNAFHVAITAADGKPISDAQVKVTLVMPAMPSMGMPEMRNAFTLPWTGSEYSGTGNIPMAGSWTVQIEATKDGAVIGRHRASVNAR